jgi:hypothetical protein
MEDQKYMVYNMNGGEGDCIYNILVGKPEGKSTMKTKT